MLDAKNSKIIADYETDVDQMLKQEALHEMAEFESKLHGKAASGDEKSRSMQAEQLRVDAKMKSKKDQIMLNLKEDLEQYSFIGVWNTVYLHLQRNMDAIVRSDRDLMALLDKSKQVDPDALREFLLRIGKS